MECAVSHSPADHRMAADSPRIGWLHFEGCRRSHAQECRRLHPEPARRLPVRWCRHRRM